MVLGRKAPQHGVCDARLELLMKQRGSWMVRGKRDGHIRIISSNLFEQ